MKQYYKRDNINAAPSTIIDENDKFISLSNGDTVLKSIFSTLYSESIPSVQIFDDVVDPDMFKQSSKMKIIEQTEEELQNSKVQQAQIVQQNQQIQIHQPAPPPAPITQIDNTQKIIDEEFEDEIAIYGINEATKRKKERMRSAGQPISEQYKSQQPIADPSEMFFKTFKRNHPIKIKLNIDEHIANPTFVKMMLENIEGDIVSYYKKIIMNTILSDIKKIEDSVEYEIRKEIFGETEAKKMLPVIKEKVKVKKTVTKKINLTKDETNEN